MTTADGIEQLVDDDRTADRLTAERADARLDDARAVIGSQAWDRVELPPIARQRYPGLDLTRPETLPEPDRCAEGRPWGVDPYGSVWGTPDQRWASYIAGTTRRGRCRNRWRDRDTLLCGTHLNAWQRTLGDAAARLRKHEAHERHTRLARRLGELGVVAEAAPGGVLLRADDAGNLADLLNGRASADRDALLDLLGAVEQHTDPMGGAPDNVLGAAARARRHLDRTPRATPDPDPNREA